MNVFPPELRAALRRYEQWLVGGVAAGTVCSGAGTLQSVAALVGPNLVYLGTWFQWGRPGRATPLLQGCESASNLAPPTQCTQQELCPVIDVIPYRLGVTT